MVSKVEQGTQRFHALDGVRASMMLLGIFFHAIWFFVPTYFGHPITEASANWGFLYVFYWVHVFRMQAFFVIAGFFACLVLGKRGTGGFVRNRTLRVALPFVVSMAILYPIMRYQMILGGLQSGRVQHEGTPLQLLGSELAHQDWWLMWPKHLWFLYTLLLVYAIALSLRFLFRNIVDRRGAIRGTLLTGMGRMLESPFAFLLLSLPIGAALYGNTFQWFGIQAGQMRPNWGGTFAYWVFFSVGWCLYQRPDLLQRVGRHWKVHFIAGTAISLGLCWTFINVLLPTQPGFLYPIIVDGDVRNYAALRQQLLDPNNPVAELAWDSLGPEYRQFVTEQTQATSDQRNGFGRELTRGLLFNPALANPEIIAGLPLSEQTQALLDKPMAERSNGEMLMLNRGVLDVALAPGLTGRADPSLGFRILYLGGYALASWLCVFGVIGFFNRFARNPSPTWRYLADSSYWLYLIHLPVLFAIQLVIARYKWPWPIKYTLYMVITFAILIPSYHYLVRSTWIGLFLNGRRYSREPPSDRS